jgi:hypothetical protein
MRLGIIYNVAIQCFPIFVSSLNNNVKFRFLTSLGHLPETIYALINASWHHLLFGSIVAIQSFPVFASSLNNNVKFRFLTSLGHLPEIIYAFN